MKTEIDKLDINKLVYAPSSWNNLKTKVDDLDVGKSKTVPADLNKLSDIIDTEVVKNTKFNTLKIKVNNLEKKIPDATKLIHISQCNTDKQYLEEKIGDVDKKIPDTSGLVTTTLLNTKLSEVENKILNTTSLVIQLFFIQKSVKLRIKFLITAKYITTPEFNKLTNFAARLKQANLATKTDFDTNRLLPSYA